jgi:hypothetical protein
MADGRLWESRNGHARHDQISKIKQVVVPWTSKRPLLSVTRPSAVPTRRPRLITVPSALIKPVSGVIGRMNEILNSRVVEPMPFSKVDWIASPMQLSSIVAASPPCTVDISWLRHNDDAPAFHLGDFVAQGLGYRIEGQRSVGQSLDKFQASHLLLLVGADRPVCPAGDAGWHVSSPRGSRIIPAS